jgi:hypothetical protein
MFGFIKNLFGTAPKAETAEVPYKVEAPVVDTADIALAQKPDGGAAVVEATQAMVESVAPKAEPAKKKPAPKKAPATKKPRAPKKPKK